MTNKTEFMIKNDGDDGTIILIDGSMSGGNTTV
jgi:hypothetical protein